MTENNDDKTRTHIALTKGTMEHVEGRSLKEFSAAKDLPIEKILELGIQICEGLNDAHEKGVTHRDVKPSNILIDSHGRAKIVDFGLASVVGTDQLTKTGSTLIRSHDTEPRRRMAFRLSSTRR